MKRMKKWISAILSIAMVTGLFGGSALEARAALPDIVDENGWSITIDYDAIQQLFDGKQSTGVFGENSYIEDKNVIQNLLTITGLDTTQIANEEIGFIRSSGSWTIKYQPEYIPNGDSLGMYLQICTKSDPGKQFYEATYKSKLTSNAEIIEEKCEVEYEDLADAYVVTILLNLGYFYNVRPDVVSENGWTINADIAGLASLLEGKENTRVFSNGEKYWSTPEQFEEYFEITGLDPACVDREWLDFCFAVYLEEYDYCYTEEDIDEDSIIAVCLDIDLTDETTKYFHDSTYLAKLTTNASLYDCCYNNGNYVDIYLKLGRLGDLLKHKPTPNPDPEPTYVEWNTDDPNVTKLMWHGGKSTYATITETKGSTEVKFTGIGWFSIPDAMDAKFQESGKDLNVTYPYKGYTVSVKIPAGCVKRTGALWYGPEYFPSLYMEDGYVTVTDYLGRKVDPQVIITKK